MDSNDIKNALENPSLNHKSFIEIFSLFCCKKEIFDGFVLRMFETSLFIKEKIFILENIPVDWILNESSDIFPFIRSFVNANKELFIGLFCTIAEYRASSLGVLFDDECFEIALRKNTAESRRLISLICKAGGLNFVNEKNIHKIDKNDLKLCFKNEYIDITFY